MGAHCRPSSFYFSACQAGCRGSAAACRHSRLSMTTWTLTSDHRAALPASGVRHSETGLPGR